MKKSIKIATLGVAALGFAAAPALGASAASTGGPFTDTINVTIDNACTFSRGTTAHTDGNPGTWGIDDNADVLSGKLAAGANQANYGSSAFNVICNNAGGWNVTAEATALAGLTTTGETIPVGTPAPDTAAWSFTPSTSDSDITAGAANAAVVAQSTKTTPTAGRNFSIQYGVSVNHVLSAQTYKGTIKYTFAQAN